MHYLEQFFKLKANNTTVRIEMLAGLSTFLTIAYVIFVNPSILAVAGMDHHAVFMATCLSAAIGSLLMGLLANYPIALAPGMGLNAYFTYSVVLASGHTWQVALGSVFMSGVIFLILSILPVRTWIVNSIPKSLQLGIISGVGLFLCIIGFEHAGLITGSAETLVKLGDLHQPTTLLAILGFFMIVSLEALGVTSAIIISILTVTALSMLLGLNHFKGVISMPPSIMPTFMQMDLKNAFNFGLVSIVFAFLLVDMFDNTGTLIGIAYRAGFLDINGKLPRLNRALIADSTAAMIGAVLGTSTTTTYAESLVGVKVGGRTGLTAVVVAALFLIATFFAPLAASVPIYATAPALIYVAFLLARTLTEIPWEDPTEYAPAMITAVTMLLTFSIAEGIAFGFISYTAVKLLSKRARDLNITLVVLAILFVTRYALLT